MKRLILILGFCLLTSCSSWAQLQLSWPPVATTGVVPPTSVSVVLSTVSFTIDAVTTGTAPTTCTFEIESSPDNVNWNSGAGSLSAPLDCHNSGVLTTSFINKPVRYLRINMLTFSGGDGTTAVTFYYTGAAK